MNKYVFAIRKLLMIIFIIASFSFIYDSSSIDLSGRWKLNASKSIFDNMPRYAAMKSIEFALQQDSLHMKWVNVDPQGKESEASETISVDGNENTSLVKRYDMTRKTTATWTADNKTLAVTSVYSEPGKPNTVSHSIIREFQLQAEGMELAVKLIASDYTLDLVYDKE